jgi:hypothetical protein
VNEPIQIDVFYPLPEGWAMCNACELMLSQASLAQTPEGRSLDEYPHEVRDEFQRLSTTIYLLADKFQDQVLIKVWDPRSLQGLWKSIRHGVHRYPTFIVNGQVKFTGCDPSKLERQIQAILESRISAL